MPNPTYFDLAGNSETTLEQVKKSVAILASGLNPDGSINTAGGSSGGGSGAVTVADGADVTQGAIADAAVVTNATGTVNAHLRGIVALLADVLGLRTRDNKAEDTPHVDADVGSFILGVRQDTLAALVSADGDYSPIAVNNVGQVKITAMASGSAGDVNKIEDTASATGHAGTSMLGVRQDNLTVLTDADGDYTNLTVNQFGQVRTTIRPSGAAGDVAKLEDSAHASGDGGLFILAVRNDGLNTALTNADSDYSPIAVNNAGAIFVTGAFQEDAAAGTANNGFFVLSVRRDVDGTQVGSDGDYSEFQTDSRGALKTNTVKRSSTATLTNVANSTSSVTVLAANSARRGFTIFNDDTAVSGAILSIKYGATASATSRTVTIAPATYYQPDDGYTGIIDGIASAATGTARITELT